MTFTLTALARLWRAITRERAVLTGLALAVLEAYQAGQITKATAVPVIAGIVLRFFVTPSNEVPTEDDLLANLPPHLQSVMIAQTDNRGPDHLEDFDPTVGELVLPQDPGSRIDG